jgi:hypothetical protein
MFNHEVVSTRIRTLAFALALSISAMFVFSAPLFAGRITLATNLNPAGALAIDPNGRSIEFSQVTQSPCAGEVDAIPADGGVLTQLSTNAALVDSGYCRGVGQLWYAQDYLVYGYGGYVTTNIDRVNAPCGNSCKHLVANLSGGNFLGTLGSFSPRKSNAYFMAGFSSLNQIPLAGGAQSVLTSGYFIESTSLDAPNPNYPASASGLFFVDHNTLNVFASDFSAGTPTTVIQSLPDEGAIQADSRYVFWWDANSIVEGAKGQTCSIPACTTLASGAVQSVVIDESEVDNSAGSVYFSDGANLWLQQKSGGVPQLMYAGANTTVLQTDGAQVYFSDSGSLFLLPVLATTGDLPINLSSVGTVGSSTLNDGFYWIDGGNGSPGAGFLSYIVEQASQVDSYQYSSTPNAKLEHKCSCKAAVYAALARYVLRAQGQFTAATGVKIDDFFYVGSPAPCAAGDTTSGGFWAGNKLNWTNPVFDNVKFGAKTKIAGDVLESMLANGPVLVQDDSKPHWVLATNVATVAYDGGQVTGIVAYEPLSGSKVLLAYNSSSSSYYVDLILDPLMNIWCSGTAGCPNLLSDINRGALRYSTPFNANGTPNFSKYDLESVVEKFTPDYAIAATVSP